MTLNKRPVIGERSPSLKAIPFFTQLSEGELDLLRSLASEKHYPEERGRCSRRARWVIRST
jgi:hypothetical protein